jgi:hypothetical protein
MKAMKSPFQAFLLLAIFATPAFSQVFPTSGSCAQTGKNMAMMITLPSITWVGSEAVVETVGKTYRGKIVGMRRHESAYRFSVLYRDDIMGFSEITVFRLPQSRPAQDRMGIVYFEELPSGERVVKAMTGYQDTACAVRF